MKGSKDAGCRSWVSLGSPPLSSFTGEPGAIVRLALLVWHPRSLLPPAHLVTVVSWAPRNASSEDDRQDYNPLPCLSPSTPLRCAFRCTIPVPTCFPSTLPWTPLPVEQRSFSGLAGRLLTRSQSRTTTETRRLLPRTEPSFRGRSAGQRVS